MSPARKGFFFAKFAAIYKTKCHVRNLVLQQKRYSIVPIMKASLSGRKFDSFATSDVPTTQVIRFIRFFQFNIFDTTRFPTEGAQALWKSPPDFTIKLLFICI